LAYFGLAGEVAAETASAPGTFMIQMLDALYTITPKELRERCQIQGE
jgi:hydroxyethylthiazole kinase